ncbi:MAG TPA: polymer-forming cytoskeletal protein [Pyrinomonadaceae bacterium]|nr:polymer-forming cytoskeletal protein [Pyrinomonadaceae bacterium]
MPPAKAALQLEHDANSSLPVAQSPEAVLPPRFPNVRAGSDHNFAVLRAVQPPAPQRNQNPFIFQPRSPVITGEASYRGYLPVEGVISGQLNASGGVMTIKQRPRNGRVESTPELDGEINFKDMLRVNGHVAGRISSEKGTLIVDTSARVDASIDVAVAVIGGTVNGDVVGRERIELGQQAVINGNISTPNLSMKPGATFQGDCRMLKANS